MARAKVTVSRSALLTNYQILSKKVPNLTLLPMIKANAYGHGAVFVANALLREKNLHGFGVATFAEAVEVRSGLKNSRIPILVFSDSSPWTEESEKLCLKYQFEPVLSELSSLKNFQSKRSHSRIKAHVEVNTGMNRMGIPRDCFSEIRFRPESVFTHLADADHPSSSLTRKQMKAFAELMSEAKLKFPEALLHFSNSSAIWNAKHYPLSQKMNLARPGLSLYGIRPFEEAMDEGLKRVMRFTAPILNRIHLKYGDEVGYGGTYQCKKKSGEWIATLGAGYADGVFRSLSSRGVAVFQKQHLKLLGRVSMDLSAMQCVASMKVGDEVELWGDSIDPYVQAGAAGTIPYEITTRVGSRVERIYK